jgi:hypothetical protein
MRPITVSSCMVGDGKVAGPHGTELVTLGLAREGRSQQAHRLLRRGRFNKGDVCGPARGTCTKESAQTIPVVPVFDMVNYPPDAEFPLPLPLKRGSAQSTYAPEAME